MTCDINVSFIVRFGDFLVKVKNFAMLEETMTEIILKNIQDMENNIEHMTWKCIFVKKNWTITKFNPILFKCACILLLWQNGT